MSSFVHANNKKKNILILGEGLDDKTLIARKIIQLTSLQAEKKNLFKLVL